MTDIAQFKDKLDSVANDLTSKVSRDELDALKSELQSLKDKSDNKVNYASIDQFNALANLVQKMTNTLQLQQPVPTTMSLDQETQKKLDTLSDIQNKHNNHLRQLSESLNNVSGQVDTLMSSSIRNTLDIKRQQAQSQTPVPTPVSTPVPEAKSSALFNTITQSQPLFSQPQPKTFVTPNPELKTDVRMPRPAQMTTPSVQEILARYPHITGGRTQEQPTTPQVNNTPQYLPTNITEKQTGTQLFSQSQQRVMEQQQQSQPSTSAFNPQVLAALSLLQGQSASNPQFAAHIASLVQQQSVQQPSVSTPQVFASESSKPNTPIMFQPSDMTKPGTVPNPLMQQRNLRPMSTLNTPFRMS